jgi:phosphoglycerol transferase MdoB-like AlkP superfamily enzyme
MVKYKKLIFRTILSLFISFIFFYFSLANFGKQNILISSKDQILLFSKVLFIAFSNLFIFINFNILINKSNNHYNKKLLYFRLAVSVGFIFLLVIFLYIKYFYMDLVTIYFHSFFFEYLLVGTLLVQIISADLNKLSIFLKLIYKIINRNVKLSYGFLFLISPFIGFILVELLNLSNLNSISIEFIFVNFILYELIHVFFFIIFRKIKLASALSLMIIYYIAIANYFVISFRGIPIVFSDIYSIKTAFSVSGGYDFIINNNFIYSMIIFGLTMLLMTLSSEKNFYRYKLKNLIKLFILFSFLIVLFNFTYSSNIYFSDISHTHWEPSEKFKKYGYFSSFIYDMKKSVTINIEDYSVEYVNSILSNYNKDKNINETSKKPNIIVVMNEAFSDLNIIGDFKTNEDYIPFFRSLEKNTIKGVLSTSPERGGGTGYTEYEFLTGNTMAFLRGTNPYVQYINSDMPSIVSTLKDQNYQALAMHPYKKSGYNRVSVYSHFGFEDFITIEEFENPETVRGNISDLENYKKVIDLYENRNQEKPFFIFNITMQNHGGYFNTGYEFDNPIKVTSFDAREDVNIFLSLMKESDLALEYLIDYFKKESKDTIILLFGDHQPMLDDAFIENLYQKSIDDLTLEERTRLYQVPFMIWANYDIEESYIDNISINYLSSILLELAKVEVPNYNRYLLNLHESMPVIVANFYMDENNNVYSFKDKSSLEKNIHNYEMIQYNNLFDLKNRLDKHFYLNN